MPCYTAWDEFLEEGTASYAKAKAEVHAKLKSVQHIVDYYYRVAGESLPTIETERDIELFSPPKASKQHMIRLAIAHHFACDDIHFCTLYDVCSLLDPKLDEGRSYEAVIRACATDLRLNPEQFRPIM